ncbi:MAG: translation initiation factor IF-3 [Ureaplasma sp.]|nr:translation initiation factor IF-3 [Ureaplasma sp.]
MNFQKKPNDKSNVMLNEKIKYNTLFVIDENGENLGEMPTSKALDMARNKSLDLLVIAVQQSKVIAKILDYGKFKFEQQRKQKENKKNQIIAKVKEIKVKPLIGDHDLSVKVEHAKKWLSQSNKVKFVIEAKGRMSTKSEFITALYDKFIGLLGDGINIVQANKQINSFRYETIIERGK